jgi:hypothetical protein
VGALVRLAKTVGRGIARVAAMLRMAPSTLRDWMRGIRGSAGHGGVDVRGLEFRGRGRGRGRGPGRPRRVVTAEELESIDELLDECRGRVGVAALGGICSAPRARLEERVREWRRCRAGHARWLEWTTPGAVWAMDWTEIDAPLWCGRDGTEDVRLVLVVRDLASSMQLLALPAARATAAVAAGALGTLFARHGAPLTLKTDNGSNVAEGEVPPLLCAWGVAHLRSPPRMPRYNGSVEAGIGSMKARLCAAAAARGRAGEPTLDDLEEARLEANAWSRPRGRNGPTPDEAWQARRGISDAERDRMRTAYDEALGIELERFHARRKNPHRESEAAVVAAEGGIFRSLDANQRANVARRAIRRALETLGHLVTRQTATSSSHLNTEMRE